MALPNRGRHSYARRAHYGAFAANIVALVGVIVAILLAVLVTRDPPLLASLRTFATETLALPNRAISGSRRAVTGTGGGVGAYIAAGTQNVELRREVAALRERQARAVGLQAENGELRALLGLAGGDVRPVTAARLLSTSATSTRREAVIDAGSNRGVRPGLPVVAAAGVLGRTLDVGPSVSRVMLITDPRSIVPARRASDSLPLIVQGRGDALLDGRMLASATVSLRVGDVIVASGTGGLYQPRTPIGRVEQVTRDGAIIRPFALPEAVTALVVQPSYAGDLPAPPARDDAEEREP